MAGLLTKKELQEIPVVPYEKIREYLQTGHIFFSSELVRDAYAKSGVLFKMNDTYISPQEIWKDERVEIKYRLL